MGDRHRKLIFTPQFYFCKLVAAKHGKNIVDYGKKRVGLVVTDPLHITANALETVSTEHIFDYLKQYLAREMLKDLDYCPQMNGQPSESMQYIQPFVKLSKLFQKQEIIFVDERFSSSLAQDHP